MSCSTLSRLSRVGSVLVLMQIDIGCAQRQPSPAATDIPVSDLVIASPPGMARPPFQFDRADAVFLEEVQRATFRHFWVNVAEPTGMVFDRSGSHIVSIAGVGFQLSALPIGVEHGWITREQGRERTLRIVRSLADNPANRHAGLFFHYLKGTDAGPWVEGFDLVVSTIDSALLFAGIVTASSYFGGEVAEIGDRLFAESDWSAFAGADEADPEWRGYLSLGWRPRDPQNPGGSGELLAFHWIDSGAEHRLVHFLAASAPRAEHRIGPDKYYGLRRRLGQYGCSGPFVWFPWSGAHFTNFFDHCWIDYAAMGPDSPADFGARNRCRVDWWENARRATLMHKVKARENPKGLPTIGKNAWGLTACDSEDGYLVAGLFPDPIDMRGAMAGADYAPQTLGENWGDGTVAPYGAGASIIFTPTASVRALRHYRGLADTDGTPLVWRDPDQGGCGFLDSFNTGTNWVAPEYVSIDQGPLLVAIENARTGLIWRLFHAHPAIREGAARLGLTINR